MFPIVYYFRPFTVGTHRFPAIRSVAQISLNSYDNQTILEKGSFDRLQRWLLRKLVRRPRTLSVQRERSQELAEHWLSWCRTYLTQQRLRGASDLATSYRRFQDFYERYSLMNVFYWTFVGDRLIETLDDLLSTYIKDSVVRRRVLIDLTTPDEPSFIQSEERALARLARRSTRERLSAAAARHSARFGWIPWNYVGPTFWTPTAIMRRLHKLGNGAVVLKAMDQHLRNVRIARRSAERRWTLPGNIVTIAEAARTQAIMQDDKKCVTTEAHYYLHFLHQEAGRRLRIPWRSLYYASFDEIIAALDGVAMPDLGARGRHSVILIAGGKIQPVVGRSAERWIRSLWHGPAASVSTLRGTPAAQGVITAKVKVVMTLRDIAKVKKGDILVTQMTTPEFIPAMKLAGAFVTDEGGLTSHAAIVARELHKPCVVGTKHATQVFKDGDRVEVDANKGVVRKL